LSNSEIERDQALNARNEDSKRSDEDLTVVREQRNELDSALGMTEGGLTYAELLQKHAMLKWELKESVDVL
jgi:hypothetical protein